ncbi:pollen-specific protein C13 [Apium graveolens]|uniref:pollen-specific protein C13 n=1 Tax=Apium graveolens TaxID=4045 RepID=UPI003D7A957A
MSKLVLLFALCILPAIVSARFIGSPFQVQGRVYCDTCRCGFETSATNYLAGAKVKIECRGDDAGGIKYSVEGVTDSTGTYTISVAYDRGDDICDAVLVSSPDPFCSAPNRGRDRSRVILTRSNGLTSNLRYANNMGFLRKQPLGGCTQLLKMYLDTDE